MSLVLSLPPARAIYRGTRAALQDLREEYSAPTLGGLSTLLCLSDLNQRSKQLERCYLAAHNREKVGWALQQVKGTVYAGLLLLMGLFPGYDPERGLLPEGARATLDPEDRAALLDWLDRTEERLDAWARDEEVTL